ncbi:patatin-like phospholipase family protein [Actinocrispum sp. NPDC049592]|uniref:patatin-like phospholipase family protein n=1 Tax=Actinocrispum sp. NPDC049592 TaxID=3154835 RepID=UPI0034209529
MTTVVLGGGGVAGIAWMTGVLAGLADNGQDLSGADDIIGTSAGSVVATQLRSGLSLEELFQRQADPAKQTAEIGVDVNMEEYAAKLGTLLAGVTDPAEMRRRFARFALDAETVEPARRRAVIADRLPSHEWPEQSLRIVAVEADTGEMRVFDKDSGVELVDAVAASCAVPGVWPAVEIDGRRYVDGGVRTADNADLAEGASRVVILVPLGTQPLWPSEVPFADVVAGLRAAGAEVTVIEPDEASKAAIGLNPLDPATRTPAANAGRAQGARTVLS